MTAITGTVSAAPLAAFATVALSPTARSFGTIDRLGAERVGAAQARAEIVRIGDAVEHEQQRRLGEIGQHVVERHVRPLRVDDRDHALMRRVTGQRREARGIDAHEPPRRRLRARALKSRARASCRVAST